MTKHLLSLAAAALLSAFALPAIACEMHESHAALTTAQATPIPVPEVKPVTVIRTPVVMPEETEAMSKPYDTMGTFGDCHHRAKQETVYLTQ